MGTVIATRSEMLVRRSRAATARRGRQRFLDRRQRPGMGEHTPRHGGGGRQASMRMGVSHDERAQIVPVG